MCIKKFNNFFQIFTILQDGVLKVCHYDFLNFFSYLIFSFKLLVCMSSDLETQTNKMQNSIESCILQSLFSCYCSSWILFVVVVFLNSFQYPWQSWFGGYKLFQSALIMFFFFLPNTWSFAGCVSLGSEIWALSFCRAIILISPPSHESCHFSFVAFIYLYSVYLVFKLRYGVKSFYCGPVYLVHCKLLIPGWIPLTLDLQNFL